MNLYSRIKYMSLFPIAEVLCFVGACSVLEYSTLASLSLVVIASVFMAMSTHICFHECVHASCNRSTPLWLQAFGSICMGLPFDGYRLHHYNHHLHENDIRDYSTTLKITDNKIIGQSVYSYCLLWPKQLIKASADIRSQDPDSLAQEINRQQIPLQRIVILLCILSLTLVAWQYTLLYMLCIYFGWMFTSLQNYGQHLPLDTATSKSFANKWYNLLTFNNGLHAEHHQQADIPQSQLTPSHDAAHTCLPHFLAALFYRRIKTYALDDVPETSSLSRASVLVDICIFSTITITAILSCIQIQGLSL